MELVIVADLEGMSGVAERVWCDPAHPEYARALEQYAEDAVSYTHLTLPTKA
jgi:D-aminopeptidase